MIAEHARIDHERIGEIDEPSVSSCLFELFGYEFGEATLDQKLTLLEVTAYSLREGGSFRHNLMVIVDHAPDMPEIATSAAIQVNEGLKLMAILQVAIVEGYSVVAANR